MDDGEIAVFRLYANDEQICSAWGEGDDSGVDDRRQGGCGGLAQLKEGQCVCVCVCVCVQEREGERDRERRENLREGDTEIEKERMGGESEREHARKRQRGSQREQRQ